MNKDENKSRARDADEAPRKKKKRRKKKSNPVKMTFTVIGTTLLSLLLIVIIVGSILAASLTVYVVQFVQNTTIDINLDNLDEESSSFIYAYDENGALVQLKKLSRNVDRVPVSIEDIPKHVQDAFVYTEDAHFWEHQGVDWKRTFGAFINEFTNIWGSQQGGSTITQQLIKNITNDKETTWDRKMREIIRAGQIEQYCTKSSILEAYLNYIGFGGRAYGVEAASEKYFGKHVQDLTVAEAACLAGIPKNPNKLNPWADEKACLERQKIVLSNMLEYGAISEKVYNEAIAAEVKFKSAGDVSSEFTVGNSGYQNWFVDTVIRDVALDFVSLYGISEKEAMERLYNGGYKVYTTCDVEMQLEVERKYQFYSTFSDHVVNDPPESAFIAMDYHGNILAIVGGIGEKSGDNIWNIATQTRRQPGSCIKPLIYSYGVEHNTLNYSTMYQDSPIQIEDEHDPESTRPWPRNYNDIWSEENVFLYTAIERSLNTVPAQFVRDVSPSVLFTFLQNKYQITTLELEDNNLAPMAVGSLRYGTRLRELVAAYQPFGNLGRYYETTTYTRVEGPGGELILEHNYTPIQSISEETAYIMNKMMLFVTEGEEGTGRAAKLDYMPVAAKTGTTQNYCDHLFVACTPNCVSGIWYGDKEGYEPIEEGTYYSAAQVWKNVFGKIAEDGATREFPEISSDKVVTAYYCAETGLIANGNCKTGGVGYYKKSVLPQVCSQCEGKHPVDRAATEENYDGENANRESDDEETD